MSATGGDGTRRRRGVIIVGAALAGVVGVLAIATVARDAIERVGMPQVPDVVYAGDLPPADGLPDLEDIAEGSSRTLLRAQSDQPDGPPDPNTQYEAWVEGADTATAEAIEGFTYTSPGDGRIEIDPRWLERNLVTTDVPVIGQVTCHFLMVEQFEGALRELELRGLAHHIDPDDWAGCYNPRHVASDPTRALSMHAFGLAFDINASTNAYGAEPQLDRDVVKVFERYGFVWGGRWRTPDGMHFELGVLPSEAVD